MMVTLHLGGFLGQRYGRKFNFEVSRIAEAVHALAAQVPAFRRDVLDYEPGFHLIVGDRDIGEERLGMRPDSPDVYLIPVVAGGNSPWLRIIVGAVIIYATWGAGTPWAMALQSVGVGLVLGGVSQLLFQPAKPPDPAERPENKPSYVFSGAVNMEAQGHPVPVLYGELRVGSIVVSSGIESTQMYSNDSGGSGGPPGGGGGGGGWDDDGGSGYVPTS